MIILQARNIGQRWILRGGELHPLIYIFELPEITIFSNTAALADLEFEINIKCGRAGGSLEIEPIFHHDTSMTSHTEVFKHKLDNSLSIFLKTDRTISDKYNNCTFI